jgi:hypothetical protein
MDDLQDLDWADCTPDWDDLPLDDLPHIPPDLAGQGTPTSRLLTMTDIEPTGSYL